MDHKSGTKSDNKMQKTQIEKDDDAEKNTLTTYNHKTYTTTTTTFIYL